MSHLINIDNDNCKSCYKHNNNNFCKRHNYIEKCLPFFDLKKSKINILNYDKTSYIYYDINNDKNITYNLNKNFTLEKTTNIIINQKNKIDLYKYLNYYIKLQNHDIYIPIYYLFINYIDIFNVFINYVNINNNKFSKNILENIFVFDNESLRYISISYRFNIFNISLLCNKFFDIIPLLINDEDNDKIKNNLIKIFEEFDIDKFYNLIDNYKFKYTMLKNDAKYDNFNDDFIFFNNIDESNKYNKIVNVEINSITNKDTVIDNLTENIVNLKNILKMINKDIPNFDKIFIMSILSLRLKKKLINNTWPFDDNYIYEYINNNKIICNKILENDLINLYDESKLVIYEYSNVVYKGYCIGDCMENTIFQFLKIIFFDKKNDNYNLELVNSIINENNKEQIKYFIDNIELEKSTNFTLDWFTYVNNLKLMNDKKFDFLKNKNNIYYELNPTLNNFILFLKNIVLSDIIDENYDKFLNKIIEKINKEYEIKININNNRENIIINCSDNIYEMILTHNRHAAFNITTNHNTKINIIYDKLVYNEKTYLDHYIKENQYIFLSNIKLYISHYLLIYNNNIYEKILNNITTHEYINDIYILFFNKIINNNIIINEKLNYTFISKIWNNKLQNLLIIGYIDNYFWSDLMNTNFLKNYDWKKFISLNYNNFINFSKNFINLELYNYFDVSTWKYIVENFSFDKYWELIKLNGDNYDLINDENWEIIIKKKLYYNDDKILKYIKNKIKIDEKLLDLMLLYHNNTDIFNETVFNKKNWSDFIDKYKNEYNTDIFNNIIKLEFYIYFNDDIWKTIIINKYYNDNIEYLKYIKNKIKSNENLLDLMLLYYDNTDLIDENLKETLNKKNWSDFLQNNNVMNDNNFLNNIINLKLYNYFNDNTWNYIKKYYNFDKYWELIFFNKNENFTEENWDKIFNYEKFYNNYLDYIVEKNIYKNWNCNIWKKLFYKNRENINQKIIKNFINNLIKKTKIYENWDYKIFDNKDIDYMLKYIENLNILEWVFIINNALNSKLISIVNDINIEYIKEWNSYIWNVCINKNDQLLFFKKIYIYLNNNYSLEIENLWIAIMLNCDNQRLYDYISEKGYKYILIYIDKSDKKEQIFKNIITDNIYYCWVDEWDIYIKIRTSLELNNSIEISIIDKYLINYIITNNDIKTNDLWDDIINNDLYEQFELNLLTSKNINYKRAKLYLKNKSQSQTGGHNYHKYKKYLN